VTDEQKQVAKEADADTKADATGDAPTDTDGQAKDWEQETAKWKAMSRRHEAQAKTNADAAKKLADMEDADKTELQKATDRAAAAEKLAAGSEAKAMRYEVAAELGIHANHLKYLTGSTKDEIEESGKGILDDFPEAYAKADKDDKSSTRPKEKLRSGSSNADELSSDPQQRARDYYATAPSKPTRK